MTANPNQNLRIPCASYAAYSGNISCIRRYIPGCFLLPESLLTYRKSEEVLPINSAELMAVAHKAAHIPSLGYRTAHPAACLFATQQPGWVVDTQIVRPICPKHRLNMQTADVSRNCTLTSVRTHLAPLSGCRLGSITLSNCNFATQQRAKLTACPERQCKYLCSSSTARFPACCTTSCAASYAPSGAACEASRATRG